MERADITAKIVASSVSPNGMRLDTLQLRYPRIIHSEFMTHRVLSRNASSSRAIPTATLLVRDASIFIPEFRHNQKGMQPGRALSAEDQAFAAQIWQDMADFCTEKCKYLAAKDGLNIHKQWTNRPLEWFGYIDVVVSSTDWHNFDHLRDHEDAQDEIAVLCRAMKAARDAATPEELAYGSWHLPYVDALEQEAIWAAVNDREPQMLELLSVVRALVPDASIDDADLLMIVASCARACRASYSNLDLASALEEDVLRFGRLVRPGQPVHATPLEHQAKPSLKKERHEKWGNYRGWEQFRKFVPGESVNG